MKCINCGSILVDGQVICSNCDTINEKENNIVENNNYSILDSDIKNNEDMDFKIFDNNFINSNEDIDVQMFNNDFTDDNIKEHTNNNKKNIYSIIILIIIIIIFVLVAKYLILNFRQEEVNDNANEFLSRYKIICQDIKIRLSLGQEVTCENNCNNIYDYDNNNYDLIIYDKDEFYEIHFSNNINLSLSMDECISLSDVTCENNKITGKIYK